MLSSLTSTDKLHARHILLIVIIGLVLHLTLIFSTLPYLVVILAILTCTLLYSLSVSNNTIFSSLFLRNPKVIKILLYVSSLTYTSISMEILSHHGLSTFQSTMLTISIVLIFQAISANLDHLLISAWKITILDLHMLIFTIITTIINFMYLNVIQYAILLLFLSWLLFIRSTSSLIFIILPTYSLTLTNSKELTLLDVFIITPLVAYAYGYASTIDKLATFTPCYDNKSLLAVVIVTTIASIFTMYTSINKLMSITYYVTLFIMFCYYIMLVIVNTKKIGNRKRL